MIKTKARFKRFLEKLRTRLSRPEAHFQLAVLGLVVGLVSGCIVISFRLLISLAQDTFLTTVGNEHYEGLDPLMRFTLPIASAGLIALLFGMYAKRNQIVGIIHVIERLSYFQGRLPFRHFVLQFIGGLLAIVGGHSVGREGPSIHLGAASSSLLGQYFKLPNNSLRILTGCGSAAAISASFNTPLAGVILLWK